MTLIDELKKGGIVNMSGKHYAICPDCRRLIRVDKPLMGSYHLCVPDKKEGP